MDDSDRPIIMWFRQDLRVSDNPALHYASGSGKPLVALFILDEQSPDIRAMGAAQKWWLHHSLASLSRSLDNLGGTLHLKQGPADDIIRDLVETLDASEVVWNRRYGEGEQAVDAGLKSWCADNDRVAHSFDGLLMHEPAKVTTKKGDPYKVYTPFWKNLSSGDPVRDLCPAPKSIKWSDATISGDALDDWGLLPTKPNWAGGIAEEWTPGEAGAEARLDEFLSDNLRDYPIARDLPGPDRTSKMSPHLRFGEVSPHQLWHACHDGRRTASEKAREVWAKELVWREFSYHLLHHWPALHEENFNDRFDEFPWDRNEEALEAWKRGRTGYPIVDAGMRQLWQHGWMHNRVRMIVGSFLVKHLLIDWREGERWFWDTLVDGDPASNPAQWQWVAGSGADAAPYFRVFNPMLQGEKFDGKGTYIRRFVPELKDLPDTYIHTPWEASKEVLKKAGVVLGDTYPHPLVDHKEARERALEAFQITGKEPGHDG